MLGPPLSHAAGRRQASLGTPVPRTPTVAPGPKARPDLAEQRGEGASTKRRGPKKPAVLGAAWRLIGRGRLRFPTTPRQLHELTSPCMQKRVMITCDRGGQRLASSGYKYLTARALPLHSFLLLPFFFFLDLAPPYANGVDPPVFCRREGKAPPRGSRPASAEEPASPLPPR